MITADMIKRMLYFDALADPQKAMVLVGMVGSSAEGMVLEKEESLARVSETAHLFPVLQDMSRWMAEASVAMNLSNLEFEPPPEFAESMGEMSHTLVLGSLIAALSVLNDLGLIKIMAPGEDENG